MKTLATYPSRSRLAGSGDCVEPQAPEALAYTANLRALRQSVLARPPPRRWTMNRRYPSHEPTILSPHSDPAGRPAEPRAAWPPGFPWVRAACVCGINRRAAHPSTTSGFPTIRSEPRLPDRRIARHRASAGPHFAEALSVRGLCWNQPRTEGLFIMRYGDG